MKLTLESDAVFVRVEDPRFGEARFWHGVDESGRRVRALILAVEAADPADAPGLRADEFGEVRRVA